MNPKIVQNSLVDYPRLNAIKEAIMVTAGIPGMIAELGVYKGGTAYLICETNQQLTNKPVLLFDTFTGMPEVRPEDIHKPGDFKDTSLPYVQELLKDFSSPLFIEGVFPDKNIMAFTNCKFSFVHLDCDIFQSVWDGLQFFSYRMSEGGIILLDDYNEPNCPGAKLATDQFCYLYKLKVEPTTQSQAIIRF